MFPGKILNGLSLDQVDPHKLIRKIIKKVSQRETNNLFIPFLMSHNLIYQHPNTNKTSYISIVYKNRIIMKVTAIIPDDIINDVRSFTGGKNITDSLIKALNDWLYAKRIEKLNQELSKNPVKFDEGFTAKGIRDLNNRT